MFHLASTASAVAKYPDGLALLIAVVLLAVGLLGKIKSLAIIGGVATAGLCIYAFSSGFFSGLH